MIVLLSSQKSAKVPFFTLLHLPSVNSRELQEIALKLATIFTNFVTINSKLSNNLAHYQFPQNHNLREHKYIKGKP